MVLYSLLQLEEGMEYMTSAKYAKKWWWGYYRDELLFTKMKAEQMLWY